MKSEFMRQNRKSCLSLKSQSVWCESARQPSTDLHWIFFFYAIKKCIKSNLFIYFGECLCVKCAVKINGTDKSFHNKINAHDLDTKVCFYFKLDFFFHCLRSVFDLTAKKNLLFSHWPMIPRYDFISSVCKQDLYALIVYKFLRNVK